MISLQPPHLLPSIISHQLPQSNFALDFTSPKAQIACHAHVTQSPSVPRPRNVSLSHPHPSPQNLSLYQLSFLHYSHYPSIITHPFILVTNYPRLCTYLQSTSHLLHHRLNSKPITHRLDTSLQNRPGYRVIMSAVIILIAAITIITASSHIHFSPLPSLHPPMTAGHHTEFPLDNTNTHTYI